MKHQVDQIPDSLNISKIDDLLGRFMDTKGGSKHIESNPLGVLPIVTKYIDSVGVGQAFELAIKHKALSVLSCLLATDEICVDVGQEHSHSLADFDKILGKSTGYSCRLLLAAIGDAETGDSTNVAVRAISQAIEKYVGDITPNVILKNGFSQFFQKMTDVAMPAGSFPEQVFYKLHELCANKKNTVSLDHLHKAFFENLIDQHFQDAIPTYNRIFSLIMSLPKSDKSLPNSFGRLLKESDLSDDAALSDEAASHIIDFLLTADPQFSAFRDLVLDTYKPGSHRLMVAVQLGLDHMSACDEGLAEKLNQLDNETISTGIKTRADFETIAKVEHFDLSKIDKNALSFEARGSFFSQGLGL